MGLAKLAAWFMGIFFIIAAAAMVFFKNDGSVVMNSSVNPAPTVAEKSDEDLTYSQEVRTFTARTKLLEQQLEDERRGRDRERLEMERRLADLQRALDKPSTDPEITKRLDEVLDLNTKLNDKNDELQASLSAMQNKVQELEQKAGQPIEVPLDEDALTKKIAEQISALGINNTNDETNVYTETTVAESKPARVRYTPYGISKSDEGQGTGFLGELDAFADNIFKPKSSRDEISAGEAATRRSNRSGNTDSSKQKVYPVYTLPVTTMLDDATLLTPLIGRVPIGGNVSDPFKFQVELGAENLAANGQKIPGVAKVIAAGTAIGNKEQSCVRGAINVLTFIFRDGRIHTVESNGRSGTSGLAYLADPWGKPCIRGEYINNAAQYLQSRSMAAFLSGLANAYGQAQTTRETNAQGITQQFISGNTYEFAAAQGISGTANEIAEYVRERSANAFDVVYVPQAQKVQLIVEKQINIDYNTEGRKISYMKSDYAGQGASYD